MMKSAEMKKSEPEKQTIQLTPEQEVVIGRLYDENYNDLFRYVRNDNRVEVIGNIYDNPELLEVKQNDD